MEVARFWRNSTIRYRLIGEICGNCELPIFPPRDVCPKCRWEGVDLGTIMRTSGKETDCVKNHNANELRARARKEAGEVE